MNRDQMNEALPNGLHDAEVLSFAYDLVHRRLSFEVDVWIGTMDQPTNLRERYQRGVLTFEGVAFFTKDEPRNLSDGGLQFLDWSLEEDLDGKVRLGETFKGKFFDFYVLYCTIRIACEDVYFEWIAGSETNRCPEGSGEDLPQQAAGQG